MTADPQPPQEDPPRDELRQARAALDRVLAACDLAEGEARHVVDDENMVATGVVRWAARPMFAADADVTVYWPDVRPVYDHPRHARNRMKRAGYQSSDRRITDLRNPPMGPALAAQPPQDDPQPDEREHAARLIATAIGTDGAVWPDDACEPDPCDYRAADAVLAAGFRRETKP